MAKRRETKIKVLFGTGRVDVVRNDKGEFLLRADRPGTLRRVAGQGTEIGQDNRGYLTRVEGQDVGRLIFGLIEQ